MRDCLAVGIAERLVSTVGEGDLDVLVRANVRGLNDLLVRAVALSDECCRGGAEEGGGSKEDLGEEHFVEGSQREGGAGEKCLGKSRGALVQTRWDCRAAKHDTHHTRYLTFARWRNRSHEWKLEYLEASQDIRGGVMHME